MIVLGIESSCDETAAAVVEDGFVRSNIVASQLAHVAYGGVVPEVASRLHEKSIIPVVKQALESAKISLQELSGIAVTRGPGLAGALVVGLGFAKGLAQALGIPITGIDHMEGHLSANFLRDPMSQIEYPFICLLVSGGHTHLWRVEGVGRYELLGQSLDDAAGEAFDKGARLLGLGYPGGPAIEAAAEHGARDAVQFPRPLKGTPSCDFSFSGLKTALFYHLKRLPSPITDEQRNDIAASYQEAIIDTLIDRLKHAIQQTGLKRICAAGGVVANTSLRSRLDEWSKAAGLVIKYPALEYCTDNAAMIAMAGQMRLTAGQESLLSIDIRPNLSLADQADD